MSCYSRWCKIIGRKNDLENDLDVHSQSRKKLHWLRSLGPGASDDDPSGIATYSQAGAQIGFGMLWMALFQYPMMTDIQEMSARIGRIKYGHKKEVFKQGCPPNMFIANTKNIGADIGAMAASVRLVFP